MRRADREFFIAFAQAFGAKMNETAMRAQLASDHAPEMYRMDTVRNLDAWYEAFDVVPGQRLYLEPAAACGSGSGAERAHACHRLRAAT